MSLSQEWNWGRLVMKHLSDALSCELKLSFCADGCVVARFPHSCRAERFWFDPHDGYLHFISTVRQPEWTVPLYAVQRLIGLLNRHIPPPGYFTVEQGFGITYRTCASMLPIPEDWQLRNWYALWDLHLLYFFHDTLQQLPNDRQACLMLYGGLEFLERMPMGKVYPCGAVYREMNRRAKNGVYS